MIFKLVSLGLLSILHFKGAAASPFGIRFNDVSEDAVYSPEESLGLLNLYKEVAVMNDWVQAADDREWATKDNTFAAKRLGLCDNLPVQANAKGLGCDGRRSMAEEEAEEVLAILQGEQGERKLCSQECWGWCASLPYSYQCAVWGYWECSCGLCGYCRRARQLRWAKRKLRAGDLTALEKSMTADAIALCENPQRYNDSGWAGKIKSFPGVDCSSAEVQIWAQVQIWN